MGEKVTRIWRDAMHGVKQETLENATLEDFVDAVDDLGKTWPTSDTFLASVKDCMRDLIMKEGFPDPGEAIFYKGRFWCEMEEGASLLRRAVASGWAFVQMQTEPLTPCYEAAEIYLKAVEVEMALKSGKAENVFAQTLLLGIALNKFQERRRHLRRLEIRKKAEDGLIFHNEGRDAANAERAEKALQWKEVANRLSAQYRARKPGASRSEVARWIVRSWPKDAGLDCPAMNTIRAALHNS